MINIGYYPGCSLQGSAKEFDKSLRKISVELGVELKEIDDWNCCGATSAHATDHFVSVALPVINIHKAVKQGLNQILAPCAACYNRLVSAQHEARTKAELKTKIENIIEEPLLLDAEIINIIQFMEIFAKENFKAKKKDSLDKLKAACYYGCLLLRPNEITKFDDPEQPSSMEEIVKLTGATPVDWNFKTECCGASHSIAHKDIVVDLSKKIIDDAAKHGADIIVVACPMCHSNLDMRQLEMKKMSGHRTTPVLYLTELLGLSLGVSIKDLGVDMHFIESNTTLNKFLNKTEAAV